MRGQSKAHKSPKSVGTPFRLTRGDKEYSCLGSLLTIFIVRNLLDLPLVSQRC